MLKRLIATIMIIAFSSVQVNAATTEVLGGEGLKTAYDELNYSLTVEWNQKDQSFRAEKVNAFMESLRTLQAKGLTNAELIDFAKSQIKDAQVAKDLQTALDVVAVNKMSPTEASKYVVEALKKSYSTGASWQSNSGAKLLGTLLILAAVVTLAVVLVGSAPASTSVATTTTSTYTPYCYYADVYVCGYAYYGYYYCGYEYDYTCY